MTGFVGSPALATGGASIQDFVSQGNLSIGMGFWAIGAVLGPGKFFPSSACRFNLTTYVQYLHPSWAVSLLKQTAGSGLFWNSPGFQLSPYSSFSSAYPKPILATFSSAVLNACVNSLETISIAVNRKLMKPKKARWPF